MIISSSKLFYHKDVSEFEQGVKRFSNALIVGQRAVIISPNDLEVFFTKGSEYQIKSTIPKAVYWNKTVKNKVLCFPGFNHRNWYHVVADMGFQVFIAKQNDLIDSIALPKMMQSFGAAFIEFFQLFEVDIFFVKHPRKALKAKEVICFDKSSGRLSEAMKGPSLEEQILQYFEFLKDSFMNSSSFELASEYGEKIFSTRRGNDSRVYEKVELIENQYESDGYQIVHFGGMSILEQMAVMHNAKVISGFHGANLTNILFAHNCQSVEELITRELSGDFKTIADFKGIKHSRRKLV